MQLIIFDCDGVLIESEILASRCELKALQQLGCQLTLDDYIEIAVGHRSHEIESSLRARYGFETPAGFWQEMKVVQQEIFEKELVSVEGIHHALSRIDLPKCVASNSGLARLHQTLSMTKLLPFFDGRIYSADLVKRSKPHPDVFLYAAEKMGVHPSECVVVEDSLVGIQAALSANMTVLAFAGGQHISQRLEASLQTSGAHQVFHSMEQLPQLIHHLSSCLSSRKDHSASVGQVSREQEERGK